MYLLVLSFISSFLLTYLVRYFALKKSLMDIPNERSSHTIPTPRGGGLAIAITWFSAITYLFYRHNIEEDLYYALLSGILLCIISFIDDIFTLKSLPRIIIHALVAGFSLYKIGGIGSIDLGIVYIPDNLLMDIAGFIGLIWFINLFNFIDGIDGYAAGESVFIACAFYFFTHENYALLLATSVLGFLLWNWDKAKIFMGDVGSTLLGFTVCILAIHYNKSGEFSIINSLILSSLFWFDATYTLYKRYRNKERLSEAHRKHLYQRIVQSGFSHQKTVIMAMIINIILFSLVWLGKLYNVSILLISVITLIILFAITRFVNNRQPFR